MKEVETYRTCFEKTDEKMNTLFAEKKEIQRGEQHPSIVRTKLIIPDLKNAESTIRELREDMIEAKHKDEAKRVKLVDKSVNVRSTVPTVLINFQGLPTNDGS